MRKREWLHRHRSFARVISSSQPWRRGVTEVELAVRAGAHGNEAANFFFSCRDGCSYETRTVRGLQAEDAWRILAALVLATCCLSAAFPAARRSAHGRQEQRKRGVVRSAARGLCQYERCSGRGSAHGMRHARPTRAGAARASQPGQLASMAATTNSTPGIIEGPRRPHAPAAAGRIRDRRCLARAC